MNFLLDTCTFLYLTLEPQKLSTKSLKLIRSIDNKLYLSPISAWEISQKYYSGKLDLKILPDIFIKRFILETYIEELKFTINDSFNYHKLPQIHKDPFDRILIAQAITNSLPIITDDTQFSGYPVDTIW